MTRTITRTPTQTPSEAGAVVSYAGAINQDGCAFCCEFICMSTPTPTPMFDPLGREIFQRASGSFLLVIEGRKGASFLDPGTSYYPAVVSPDRGDLQVLLSRSTGEPGPGFGSIAVCDNGPPPAPFGGVPGFTPPDFNDPSQQVTDAIHDLTCRFTLQDSVQNACTRDAFGDFGFLGSNTVKQFCYQVPISGQFQVGDTIIAIQLRDEAGNLGPKKEIVVRVDP
jgi:hypothetical protein